MTNFEKITGQELEQAAGGQSAGVVWKTVANLKEGYLAVRTAPEARYGEMVQVTGGYVQGTTLGGGAATYVWVFVPRTGVSGYVNAAFLK